RSLARTFLLASVIPFVSSLLGGIVAFSMLVPSGVSAQPGQAEEVRASAFTVVGSDGTVLARLGPGRNANGSLTLFDTDGTRRLILAGGGAVQVYDQDGTTLAFRAG